jgi:hypothetical protein
MMAGWSGSICNFTSSASDLRTGSPPPQPAQQCDPCPEHPTHPRFRQRLAVNHHHLIWLVWTGPKHGLLHRLGLAALVNPEEVGGECVDVVFDVVAVAKKDEVEAVARLRLMTFWTRSVATATP